MTVGPGPSEVDLWRRRRCRFGAAYTAALRRPGSGVRLRQQRSTGTVANRRQHFVGRRGFYWQPDAPFLWSEAARACLHLPGWQCRGAVGPRATDQRQAAGTPLLAVVGLVAVAPLLAASFRLDCCLVACGSQNSLAGRNGPRRRDGGIRQPAGTGATASAP